MSTVHLKINGIEVEVPSDYTVLLAAKEAGIEIPSLCYLKDVNQIGACRICVVEVKNKKGLVASCALPVEEGMEVFTNTPAVRRSRKVTLELLLSEHDQKCLSCSSNQRCELQRLCLEYGVDDDRFTAPELKGIIDETAPYIVRNNNKCILCRRCIAVCSDVQGIGAIGAIDRGNRTHITGAFERTIAETTCVGCGQCVVACPTGALSIKSNIDTVWDAIGDPTKKVVVFTAPAVRATLGEYFNMPVGTNVEGKMVAGIKQLGVDGVFNMDFTADLTIMEEATELVERIKNNDPLPMFTSCCPGWVKYCEHNYPEMLPHVSSCKSPQQMFGAVLKNYYCAKNNIDPKDLFVVSVIPCTAKKFEVGRDEINKGDGFQDVDVALTTTELGKMIATTGVTFTELKDSPFDDPFEIGSGAGTIFAATGGVIEAAVRTAAAWLDPSNAKIEYTEVRGPEDIREVTYKVGELEINVAVTSGLANVKKVIEDIKAGRKNYQMVEFMACPGGCINGGGQPHPTDSQLNFVDLKGLRSKALYDADAANSLRQSHENPIIKKIYEEYFEAPGKEKSHKLLHTTYVERESL